MDSQDVVSINQKWKIELLSSNFGFSNYLKCKSVFVCVSPKNRIGLQVYAFFFLVLKARINIAQGEALGDIKPQSFMEVYMKV